jgi:hypothetical protein
MIPLLKKDNTAAKHEFFRKKKKIYQNSAIRDVLDVAKEKDWTPKEIVKYQKRKVERLLDWFGLSDK